MKVTEKKINGSVQISRDFNSKATVLNVCRLKFHDKNKY